MLVDILFHVVIVIEALVVTYLFFVTYKKTQNKNLLILSTAFALFGIAYASHLIEDVFGFEFKNWFLMHVDHLAPVIVSAALIWILWPRSKWQKPITHNQLTRIN